MKKKRTCVDLGFLLELYDIESHCISIFDHCLSESEAFESSVICYSAAKENNKLHEYKIFENKFRKLYYSSYLLNGGSVVRCPYLKYCSEIRSIVEYDKAITLALRERDMTPLYFDKIGLFVEFDWDMTHVVHIDKHSPVNEVVLESVIENGLYFL